MRQLEIENIFKKANGEYIKYKKGQKLFLSEYHDDKQKILLHSTAIGELEEVCSSETGCYDRYLLLDLSVCMTLLTKSDVQKFIDIANKYEYFIIFVPFIPDEFIESHGWPNDFDSLLAIKSNVFGIYSNYQYKTIFDTLSWLNNFSYKKGKASMLITNSKYNILFGASVSQIIDGDVYSPEDTLLRYYIEKRDKENSECISLTEPNIAPYQYLLNCDVSRLNFFVEEKHPTEGYILFKNNIANKSTVRNNGLPFKCDKIKFIDKTYTKKVKKLEEIIEGGK